MNKINFKFNRLKVGKNQTPKTEVTKKKEPKKNIYARKLSIKDQTFFVKRLSFLIKAGIPLLESLHIITEQTKSRNYSRILETITDDVASGQTLSRSLGKFKKSFGEFSINIIAFGETSGILSENLEYLADELKKRQALRRKVVGSMIYPAVVTLATIAITSFLILFLFPKIIPVFSSLHGTLPLSTRMLIALSNFLKSYGLYLLAALFIIAVGTIVAMEKSLKFRYQFDKFLLKIPGIGNAVKNYNLANSTRTLGLLLKSGITASEAFPITAKTSQNLVYKEGFEKMSLSIDRGERLSAYINKRSDIFPDVISQIISVGERSGNLSNSLVYLSEMYEAEVDEFTKNLSNLIEPVLMIFMGIIVGFIAISIITPIYSITQYLQVK